MYSAIQQLVPPFFFDKGAIPFGPSLASCTPVQVLHDAENIGGAEMPNLSWSRCLCAEPCQNFVIQEVMIGAWISSLDFFNGSSYAKRASFETHASTGLSLRRFPKMSKLFEQRGVYE